MKPTRLVRKIQSFLLPLLLGCLALSPSVFAANTTVDGIRIWRAPDHTRVVFDLSGAVQHKIFELKKPSRLVVDITGASNRASLSKLDLAKTPISLIRSGRLDNSGTRFVFDLKQGIKPRSFPLKKHGGKPHRLVVDLYDKEQPKAATTVKKVAKEAKQSILRDVIIVVDAGHGGEDPGATGPKRIREKNVVLDISKRLANKINKTPGYVAKLTRTGDYYLSLKKRRDFARAQRADLFVSIHADAFKTPQARGASVFTLSNRGATSETARFLASRENSSDLIGGVGEVDLADKDKVLAKVLVDLSMSATRSSSLDVGGHVLKQMGRISKLHKNRVEQAGFLVLKSPDVPSILVETGFISNPTEAKRLATKAYREKMASSIFTGIRRYFENTPPAGTFLADKHSPGKNFSPAPTVVVNKGNSALATYRVRIGDTLSEIAERHKMSLAEIKRANGLKKNTIRIGQRLKVKSLAVANSRVHRVASGDTLSAIALRYNSSINAIRKLNKLSSSSIRIGQRLMIPAG